MHSPLSPLAISSCPNIRATNPSDVKFLLLHDQRIDENAVKCFFYDLYELYIKILMNPFQEKAGPIKNASFDSRVKVLSKKYFAAF